MDISIYLLALVGGAISFLSPCVLPLVPPYLCYMAGANMAELRGQAVMANDGVVVSQAVSPNIRKTVVVNALLFVLGFSLVFVALGASASIIGQFVLKNRELLSTLAGLVIIIMGLHFLGLFRLAFMQREARFQAGGAGPVGSMVMGFAFAFGWTPCIGPILGSILAQAGARDTAGEGAMLLAVYSAGLGVPFVLAALFVEPFLDFLQKFKRHMGLVEKAMGIFLIAIGILFLTGSMQRFSFWLLEIFPFFANVG